MVYLAILCLNALFFSTYNLLAIYFLSFCFYYLNLYYTSALLVQIKQTRKTFSGKPSFYNTSPKRVIGLFRSYSTNSPTIAPSFQPAKVYIKGDKYKVLILKENKGKCGIYR